MIVPDTIARLVHYSGNVQGVGFRLTAVQIAGRFAVTGWVRNLPDGRVRLFVEGDIAEVEGFLQTIRDHWRGYLRHEQVDEQSPTGSFPGFDLVH